MAYPTVAEIRAWFPVLADSQRFSDDLLDELVAEFVEVAETYCGCAFTEIDATVTVPGSGTAHQVLQHHASAVSGVTVDGVEWTEDQLADLTVVAGIVTSPRLWAGVVEIAYTHGTADTPPAVRRACREFVRAKAIEAVGEGPRNSISYQDDSGWSYRDSTADWSAGRPTGLRAVDDALNSLALPRDVGVA